MVPEKSPAYEFDWPPSPSAAPSTLLHNLSPPLIAMLAVLATALLILLISRLISLRGRPPPTPSEFPTTPHSQFSPPPYSPFPYGLDDATIKSLPLSIFSTTPKPNRDCAVCLFEFNQGNCLRTLPLCAHAFHVECIDAWLRSHPSCPLCRAAVSFVPMRASRIRPSLDNIVIARTQETASPIVLKRSYSFGAERSPAWRLRQQQQQRGFWSRRWQSPFGGVMKSPFVRRWGRGSGGRRSRSMTSPSGVWAGRVVGFSSSRMRCGDPEALLSPERFDRR